MKLNQRGSIEAVVIACLVAALIFALGWIFWQNFVHKDQKPTRIDTPVVQNETKLTKEACLIHEKLCFRYPVSWTINSTTIKSEGVADADNVSVNDGKDINILTIQSGISGLGGTCGEDVKTSLTVVKSEPTKIRVNVSKDMTDYQTPTVYAVQAYYHDPSKGYAPFVHLSNSIDSASEKTTPSCLPGLSAIFPDKNITNGSVSASSVNFFDSSSDGTQHPFTYSSTVEQAKQKLNAGDLATAYQVLATAYYK